MLLTLRVQLIGDESLPSFISRLAAKNRVSLAIFCSHFGIDLQRFVDGCSSTLKRVAGLSLVSPDDLRRHALVRTEDGFELSGERLQLRSLRRDHLHVCPHCLAADVEAGGAPYGRVLWQIAHLRACAIHNVDLHDFGPSTTPALFHDISARMAPHLHSLAPLAASATAGHQSPFESYVQNRLRTGVDRSPFLDGLQLHAAARFCELLGSVATSGIWPHLKTFTVGDWREAADAGYAIAEGGEEPIRSFLRELQRRRTTSARGQDGAQAVFGNLYDWLSRGSPHTAYDPLRDVFHRHIVETMPIGSGEVVLGRVVERRVLHSVHSAHLEMGMHPKRLTKLLAAEGVLRSTGGSDGTTLFDARRGQLALSRFTDVLSLKEVGTYLGSDRVHTRLLHEAGLIKSTSETGGKMAFPKNDLDAFLSALMEGADTLEAGDERATSIPLAAKRANCSAMEIVRLIIDRKLKRRGIQVGEHGYGALLVDFEEVRSLVRGVPLEGIPRRWVIKELKTNYRVVDALIEQGVLATEQQINPLNRCPIEVVPRRSLDAFRATYGTLFELAAEAGCHPRTLKMKLAKLGIEPALSSTVYHASFYERARLPAV